MLPRVFTLLLLTLGLLACSQSPQRASNSYYIVKSGDSLSSIGQRFRIDHRALARWNAIRPPYTIYPGQKLKLYPPVRRSQAKHSYQPGSVVVRKGDTIYSIAFRHGLDYRRLARWNGIRSPYTIYPGQRLSLKPGKAPKATTPPPRQVASASPVKPAKASSPAKADKAPVPAAGGPLRWRWPTNGTLLVAFKQDGKGIDIGGRAGQPIVSAAAGKVVYSGSGLVGYGRLIIIKHNNNYLSAYGHNKKLLVKEGDSVKAGEQIALMGYANAHQAKLHFEIRRDGNPVNPERYLPPR